MAFRKFALSVVGVGVYAGGVYAAYNWKATKAAPTEPVEVSTSLCSTEVWNNLASTYDKSLWVDEFVLGLPLIRRSLLKKAEGSVLEVAAGTGRNIKYYPENVTLTLSDVSKPMLEKAAMKAQTIRPVKLAVWDAQDLATVQDESYDTVVDTFGLCSSADPVQMLKEMKRVCKKDGKVLLLEHGRALYDWLNGVLDRGAEKHARDWGCIYNRDIETLVEKAGLKVNTIHRFHLGTTYYIVASPE
eukprot:Colp12_sorted_trinity150504_noHs@366